MLGDVGFMSDEFLVSVESNVPGIVDYATQIIRIGETLVDAISRARSTMGMTEAQRVLLDAQIQRARAGLPPLSPNTSQYPTIGAGISPLLLLGAAFLLKGRK